MHPAVVIRNRSPSSAPATTTPTTPTTNHLDNSRYRARALQPIPTISSSYRLSRTSPSPPTPQPIPPSTNRAHQPPNRHNGHGRAPLQVPHAPMAHERLGAQRRRLRRRRARQSPPHPPKPSSTNPPFPPHSSQQHSTSSSTPPCGPSRRATRRTCTSPLSTGCRSSLARWAC